MAENASRSSPVANLRKSLRPLGRLLRKLYSDRRRVVFDYDLAAGVPEPPGGPITFREATREDVLSLAADPAQEVSRTAARRHRRLLEEGAPFFIGLSGGRIVYHAWASLGRWRIAGPHVLRLGRGNACIMGCFTVASLRGQGIYPAALAAQLRALWRRGARRVFIEAEEGNAASLRGIEKAGFRRLGVYEVRRRAGATRLLIPAGLRRAVEEDSAT